FVLNLCVAKIVALIEDGRSIRYVSNELGFLRSSVHRACNRYRETNSFNRRCGSGRKRSTTARDGRCIQMSALRNRYLTAVSHRNELRRVRQVNVSFSTIRRRLYEVNFSSARLPLKGSELLPRDWNLPEITLTGLRRMWLMFCSPISQNLIYGSLMVVYACGEGNMKGMQRVLLVQMCLLEAEKF
ncbi:hypothetical protein ILUMI_03288, partial [Ignelater luminosus]